MNIGAIIKANNSIGILVNSGLITNEVKPKASELNDVVRNDTNIDTANKKVAPPLATGVFPTTMIAPIEIKTDTIVIGLMILNGIARANDIR